MPRVALPKTRFLRILEVLITNAVEAMSSIDGDRKLVLRCYKTRDRVWLEVEDNGKRIIFRDNVSVTITKPVERGTASSEKQTQQEEALQ